MRMRFPCEIVIWYLLPAIRSALAKELAGLGLSQKEISEKLGISEAAVSQYMKGKRGGKIGFSTELNEMVREAARHIVSSASIIDVYRKTCNLCLSLRKRALMCDLHRKMDNVPEDCNLCPCLSEDL